MLKKLRTVSGSGIKRMLNVSSKKCDEICQFLKIVYHYSLYKTRHQFTYNIYNISTTNLAIPGCLNEKLDNISDGNEYLYEWNIINIIPDESECLYCKRKSMSKSMSFIPDENKPII
ncbi:hypothetical protein RIR_jg29661.t1 [Rhizophagus irregularis DAOM 181602=DAOM 197198]|nr:hypothetical protein RIR_jg29661.t1 [Rhizophagus irregularis DAOM 181602=DAOM 197198]CAG8702929.1 7504_t:CDS:2 [Rhizophagus irregularis]